VGTGLSQRLREDGIPTILDQHLSSSPPLGWPRWMLDQLETADRVLVICTETYYRRFRGHVVSGKGKGSDWEGAIITQQIYDDPSRLNKFVPVLPPSSDTRWIPDPLRSSNHYTLTSDDAYRDLYDFLLGQGGVEPRPVGPLKSRPRPTATPLDFSKTASTPEGGNDGSGAPPASHLPRRPNQPDRQAPQQTADQIPPRPLFLALVSLLLLGLVAMLSLSFAPPLARKAILGMGAILGIGVISSLLATNYRRPKLVFKIVVALCCLAAFLVAYARVGFRQPPPASDVAANIVKLGDRALDRSVDLLRTPTRGTAEPSGERIAGEMPPSSSLDVGRVRAASGAPVPLITAGQPVTWWFVFKFNTAKFPGCGADAPRSRPFGGDVQQHAFGQQFVYASSANPSLQKGEGCAGETNKDPLGATFGQVYNNSFHYLIWNDQFYDDPRIQGCTKECGSPWGYSKGMLAWNDAGEGVVLQVSTPSWPAAGSKTHPRNSDGNTLGCVKDDDVKVSQHFFALKLTKTIS
jgi:hypothetical protein